MEVFLLKNPRIGEVRRGFFEHRTNPSRTWPERKWRTRALDCSSRWRWCSVRRLTTPAVSKAVRKTRFHTLTRSVCDCAGLLFEGRSRVEARCFREEDATRRGRRSDSTADGRRLVRSFSSERMKEPTTRGVRGV